MTLVIGCRSFLQPLGMMRIAASVALAASACDGSARPGRDFAPESLPERTAEQLFTIGGVEAEGPAAFASTPVLTVDTAGRIYARDSRAAEVRVFGPDGDFLGARGGAGEGPGEFTRAADHGLLGDTLWIADFPSPTVGTFTVEGALLDSWDASLPGGTSPFPELPDALLTGGRIFVVRDAGSTPEGADRAVALLGDRALTRADTIAERLETETLVVEGVGGFALRPFLKSPTFAVDPLGRAVTVVSWADSAGSASPVSYLRIERFGAGGEVEEPGGLPLPTRPLPTAVVDSIAREGIAMVERTADAIGDVGDRSFPDDVEAAVREGLSLPARYPPLRRVVSGVDGTLWLELHGGGLPGRWLVLDRALEPLFRVVLPGELRVHAATRDRIWGVVTDELDVARVVAYRVR